VGKQWAVRVPQESAVLLFFPSAALPPYLHSAREELRAQFAE